jgi:protein TonB
MNHFDIQQASLLDILFAQRNKQYGAYVLRKYYNNRLMVAVGVTLVAAFSAFLLAAGLGGADPMDVRAMPKTTEVEIQKVTTTEPEKPKPVEQIKKMQQDYRTEPLTTKIIIEKNAVTNVASTDDLKDALVGTKKIAGDIAPPDIHTTSPVGPQSSPAPMAAAEEEHPFVTNPSEAPYYPGGDAAWREYLARHINVPGDMEPGEKRSVLIRFLVSEDGSVTGFEVIRSAGASFDNEVLRVLRQMPKWKPARQNGRAVSTSFQQPVTFAAPEE